MKSETPKISSGNFSLGKTIAGVFLLLITVLICLSIGPDGSVKLLDIENIQNLVNGNWDYAATILYKVRLPRIFMGIIVGGSLAVSGLVFQNILQNPLADPYLIGVSGGCALAAVFLQVLGFHNPFSIAIGAFVGGMLSMLFVEFIASRTGRINRSVLILAGVVLNAFFSAMISLLLILAGSDMARIFTWLLGSLNLPDTTLLFPTSIIAIVCLTFLWVFSHQLDMVSLGDFHSYHLGLNPEKIKWISIICASILTSISVSLAGMIGFVGMFVPHTMRFIFGFRHSILLPMCFVGGAICLIVTDTVVRVAPTGSELPVGALTALFGGPFFLLLLVKKFRSLRS